MGSTAGTITVYTTQSFDSIKPALKHSAPLEQWRRFNGIFLNHSLKGFWRGSTMRLGRLILGDSIVFIVYEKANSTLRAALLPGH